MDMRTKALAILLTTIIAVALGATIYALGIEKPKIGITPSSAVVEPAAPDYIGNSSIFLISATSSFGPYPFVSAVGPQPGATPVIEKGNRCFIVNLTVRNDYAVNNLPPNETPLYYANGSVVKPTGSVYVFLTVKLYDKQGNVVQAIDVTPPYGLPNGGAYDSLQSGQGGTLTIYMATSQKDIDHFGVVLEYVGNTPPP